MKMNKLSLSSLSVGLGVGRRCMIHPISVFDEPTTTTNGKRRLVGETISIEVVKPGQKQGGKIEYGWFWVHHVWGVGGSLPFTMMPCCIAWPFTQNLLAPIPLLWLNFPYKLQELLPFFLLSSLLAFFLPLFASR